jgi:hypothetical protein
MLSPNERGEVIAHVGRAGRSPGPAAYHVKRSLDAPETPVIRMRGRPSTSIEVNRAPYYNLRSSIGTATPITLHGRPRERAPEVFPGISYMPPAFGSAARKIGFAGPSFGLPEGSSRRATARSTPTPLGKRRNPDETPGPGPGRYVTRGSDFDSGGKRGVQMKGDHEFDWGDPHTPGPAAYRPRSEKVLPAAPKYGLHGRTKLPEREPTPGYRDIGSSLGGPRYTMKGRADDEVQIV